MNLEMMAVKGYSTFPSAPELKAHFKMKFNITPRTLLLVGGVLPSAGDTVNVFIVPTIVRAAMGH